MSKFTFTCENYGTDNTMSFKCDTWNEALENFETFLKGSGFVFDGTLTAVAPELEEVVLHSDFYYKFDRNL